MLPGNEERSLQAGVGVRECVMKNKEGKFLENRVQGGEGRGMASEKAGQTGKGLKGLSQELGLCPAGY